MLKIIRVIIAVIFLIGITVLLTGVGSGVSILNPPAVQTGWNEWTGWMAKLQFLPACLATNVVVITALCILTLVAGRIYCSVICPLGIFQDSVLWLRRRLRPKKKQSFKKEHRILRYTILAVFIAAIIAGVQVIVAMLDPYSIYGRAVGSIVRSQGWIVPTIAGVTAAAIIILVWTGGRTWCNDICPVGTTLSFLSRIALLRPVIDSGKCSHCGACERVCRSSCIDSKEGSIDTSRCVDCFDCLESCKAGALSYRPAWGVKDNPKGPQTASKARAAEAVAATGTRAAENQTAQKAPAAKAKAAPQAQHPAPGAARASGAASGTITQGHDPSRRAFITAAAITAGSLTLKAQGEKLDGGLAILEDKKKPHRKERPVPFGAGSLKDFYSHCTACQLCVSACPEKVLKPSTDLQHLMQPEMDFVDGYCRPGCTDCSQLCPSGAISPLTPEEKSMVHIGTAVVDPDLCVVNRDGVSCGNCARHCPASAIRMVPKEPGSTLRIPTVKEEACTGCGACEHLCPSRPYSAIHVDGISVHRNS